MKDAHMSFMAGRQTRCEIIITGNVTERALDTIVRQVALVRDWWLEDATPYDETTAHQMGAPKSQT